MSPTGRPTVVLVHGAFADASGFARVIPELIARGLDVMAPAVPNRGLLGDSAHIALNTRATDGPVVLVGHSYGGAVITVAGTEDNVRALVYLAGYAWTSARALGTCRVASRPPTWPACSCTHLVRSMAPPLRAPT